jgi:hypothetical protein
METFLQNDFFWLFILIIVGLTFLFVYIFLKDLSRKIEIINRRYKMLAAISFEFQLLYHPAPPKRISLLRAGINIDDLKYFGYTTAEIQVVFPDYKP